jgi:hypothetical protein
VYYYTNDSMRSITSVEHIKVPSLTEDVLYSVSMVNGPPFNNVFYFLFTGCPAGLIG